MAVEIVMILRFKDEIMKINKWKMVWESDFYKKNWVKNKRFLGENEKIKRIKIEKEKRQLTVCIRKKKENRVP